MTVKVLKKVGEFKEKVEELFKKEEKVKFDYEKYLENLAIKIAKRRFEEAVKVIFKTLKNDEKLKEYLKSLEDKRKLPYPRNKYEEKHLIEATTYSMHLIKEIETAINELIKDIKTYANRKVDVCIMYKYILINLDDILTEVLYKYDFPYKVRPYIKRRIVEILSIKIKKRFSLI